MKRVAAFLALLIALDLGLGAGLGWLFRRTMTGERGGVTNYGLAQDADVLVLGSSRAQMHVMPSLLSSELSLKVFNAGLKGHDLLYAVMFFDLWKRRHAPPRAVVLIVDPETMLLRENELGSDQIFGPYIGESDVVRDVLYLSGPYKRIEYLSRAYRYNGKVLAIAKNLFVHRPTDVDGFVPAIGQMDVSDPIYGAPRHGLLDFPPVGEAFSDERAVAMARLPFWEPKVRLLRELGEATAKTGARLFLVHPPIWGLSREAHDAWVAQLEAVIHAAAAGSKVEFIDSCEFAYPETFAGKPELYRDFAHLNQRGATLFSALLGTALERRLASPARSVASNGERAIVDAPSSPAPTVPQPIPMH